MRSLFSQKGKILFLICDFVLLFGIYILFLKLRFPENYQSVMQTSSILLLCFITTGALYVFGGYDFNPDQKFSELFKKSALAIALSISAIIFLNYIFSIERGGIFGRGVLLGSLVIFWILHLLYRGLTLKIFNRLASRARWLVLLDTSYRSHFEKELSRNLIPGSFHFFDKTNLDTQAFKNEVKKKWSGVIVGVPSKDLPAQAWDVLMTAKFEGISITSLSSFYETYWKKVPIFALDPKWFVTSEGFENISAPVARRLKRLFDVVFAILLITLTFPVMLLTALIIKLESKGPAIYSQIRTGKGEKPFRIYKFRSMRTDAEKDGVQWAQKNDSRVTKVGRFIRKTRIDELPQLWNVLKGDMSVVGPRPERPEFNQELSQQIEFYNFRHTMQPGLTGWAQVLYPYGASIEDAREKLKYDLYYAKHFNLLLDLKILLKTVNVVLGRRGR
jgi:exopolysaccharide biosynthesis polyprenyl glycosylphosphotransferase